MDWESVRTFVPRVRQGTAPKKKRGPNKPTITSVAKQANKAGIAVARYEVEPNGKIIIVAGKPAEQDTNTGKNIFDIEAERLRREGAV
jgi:hypothetical protein